MKKRALPILVGILILLIFVGLSLYSVPIVDGVQRDLDDFMYDSALKANLLAESTLPEGQGSIVIVDIDEDSIRSVGRWPWKRNEIATLIENIRKSGAIVIAFDILFSEKQENVIDQILAKANGPITLDSETQATLKKMHPQFDYDEVLRQSLRSEDSAMGFFLNDELGQTSYGALPEPLTHENDLSSTAIISLRRYYGNIESFQKTAANGGFTTAIPDADGVIRRAPLVLGFETGIYPSLSLEAARLALLFEKKDIQVQWGQSGDFKVVDGIRFGDKLIPTDIQGRVLIPFSGAVSKFKTYTAVQLLRGELPSDTLKNAIVFVGSSALSLSDLHVTPVNPLFPGVAIHAYLTEGLLTGSFLHTPYYADLISLIMLFVIGVVLAFLLPFLDALWMVLVFVFSMILVLGVYVCMFRFESVLISASLPVGLGFCEIAFNLVYGMLFEFRRRNQLKNLFGQYVPKEIVERMSEHPELYSMDGTSETLSVLFADVVHFTSVCESLTPKQIRMLLNRYFTPMTKIILDNSGTIDKYVGDMIMAFWGAPVSDPNHASHALNSALEMSRMVKALGPEFQKDGLPAINMGIGVNTGMMSVGDMGSQYRRAYTVLGDTVNTGSRIEGLTRFYGVGIAVGPQTREGQNDFAFKLLDRVRVKGKAYSIEIFELVARTNEVTQELAAEIDLHERAMKLYFSREFKEAARVFGDLLELSQNKILYNLFLERSNRFETAAPPENWDGSTEWTQK